MCVFRIIIPITHVHSFICFSNTRKPLYYVRADIPAAAASSSSSSVVAAAAAAAAADDDDDVDDVDDNVEEICFFLSRKPIPLSSLSIYDIRERDR